MRVVLLLIASETFVLHWTLISKWFLKLHYHRVASTPELATDFIDYKQIAGMTTVRKSCYYTVLYKIDIFLSEHIYL